MSKTLSEKLYRREIEKLSPAEAVKDWEKEYRSPRGHMNNLIGEVGEIYVNAVMGAFDGRKVDGETYFNQPASVTLPVFENIERRGGIVQRRPPCPNSLPKKASIFLSFFVRQYAQCRSLNTSIPVPSMATMK